ncbi:MAG: hypothetical protein AB7V46_15200, partial [Thermomicrobiales bacterium]
MRTRVSRVLSSFALFLSVALIARTHAAHAFCTGRVDSVCHPEIIFNAMPFLRPEFLRDIINHNLDMDSGTPGITASLHFDECDFEDSVESISDRYDLIVSSNFRPLNAIDFYKGIENFGELLHPVQDFYSHSNWSRLGFSPNILIARQLGPWPSLAEWQPLDISAPVFVLSGNKTFSYSDGSKHNVPEGFTVVTPPDSGVPIITTTDGFIYRGLISGSPGSVGSPNSDCPDGADFSHETLNRDNIERDGHCLAVGQALLQTKVEWCRLIHLLADEYGPIGPAKVFTLLVDGNRDEHLRSTSTCPRHITATLCDQVFVQNNVGTLCGPHHDETPCGPEQYGSTEISVSLDHLRILEDHDQGSGELTFVLGAYTNDLNQSTRSQ